MSGPILLVLRVLMAAALYVFITWSMLILWKELRMHGATLIGRRVPPIGLVISRDEKYLETRYYNRPEFIIGRDPACDCHINDETVSAVHARLSYHHGQWWMDDLGSSNGIQLNNQTLTTSTIIVSDDEIICGQTYIRIQMPGKNFDSKTQPLHENDEEK